MSISLGELKKGSYFIFMEGEYGLREGRSSIPVFQVHGVAGGKYYLHDGKPVQFSAEQLAANVCQLQIRVNTDLITARAVEQVLMGPVLKKAWEIYPF